MAMRRFLLLRNARDIPFADHEQGFIRQQGDKWVVAEGVQFSTNRTAICWLAHHHKTEVWGNLPSPQEFYEREGGGYTWQWMDPA